jgi:hypothetical protein
MDIHSRVAATSQGVGPPATAGTFLSTGGH